MSNVDSNMEVTIHKATHSRDCAYVMINRNSVQDKNLSWKAKGLLAYVLSLPDDWDIRLSELANHSPDGLVCLTNTIVELEENGYIIRKRFRSKDGKFSRYKFYVYEIPVKKQANMLKTVSWKNRAMFTRLGQPRWLTSSY